jgi:LPXTG-motif cell wall-anchored protein
LATTLPETGSSSAGSLTLATMALGLGLLLIAFARRSA